MRRLFREPVAIAFIVGCLLFVTPDVTSQRKQQKPQPTTEELLAAGTVETAPKDEILFNEYDFLRLRRSAGWRLAVSTDDTDAYYDPSRMSKNAKSARGWIKYVDKSSGGNQSHALVFEEFNCVTNYVRSLDNIKYAKDDTILSNRRRPGAWKRIVPESVGDELYKVLCKGASDEQETRLRQTNECFMYGRQEEKKGQFELARLWYVDALTFAPGNAKILAAMKRVSK